MADIRSLIAGDDGQTATAVVPPSPPAAPPVVTSAKSAALPAPVKQASTIQRIKPTAAQMAEVQANNDADLKGVAESKRQQALAIAQQMAGHIQRNDTASATAAAAQLGALNREIQAIGGQPVPMPSASAPMVAPMAAASAPAAPAAPQIASDARALIAGDGTKAPAPVSATQHFIDAFNTIRNNKPALLASTADVVANAPSAILNFIGTASGRLTGETPEKSQKIGQAISSFAANPFGRLTGTTESPQYQGLQSAVAAPFEYATNKIAQTTGMNPVDASLLVGAGTMALPEAKKFVAKNIAEAAAIPAEKAGRTTAAQAEQRAAANATAADQLQQQFAAKQAAAKATKQAAAEAAAKPADFGAAYTTAAEPPLFKPTVELTPDENGVYREKPPLALPGAFGEEPVAAEAQPVAAEMPASVGAAGVPPAMSLRGSVDAALANASPELQQFVGSKDIKSINLPSLETRALEEKHGVNLTVGQRTGDTQQYSTEWNRRGETPILGNYFNEQPAQISTAFETAKQKNAPDISPTADASELGQHEINALAAKDQVRRDAISSAYKALEDENGGQFPIDTGKVKENIDSELLKKYKSRYLSEGISGDLQQFLDNPTFEGFEALRTNLSDEMRSAQDGKTRQAAYIVREQLEKMPVFGEETGSPQAMRLKELADNARNLNAERMNVIKSNPAYKAAIKEASDAEGASSEGESLNAATFHKKYVSSATPESIRRMKAEIPEDDIAHQAMIFGELERAKNAAINASDRNLTPEKFASFYKTNKSALTESLSPQAMQDVTELGLLTSKIGMPKTGTFNYSNTYSSMLGDMAKEGLLTAGEAKLAGATGGMSIPVLGLARQFMGKLNKEGFAREATNPHGGLTKD